MNGSNQSKQLYNLRLTAPADLDDARIGSLASCLEERALATTMARRDNRHDQPWDVVWLLDYLPGEDEIGALAAALETERQSWTVEEVPAVNWLEHSYRQFQPFTVGRFFVYGSHFAGTPPAGTLPLQIDAATAFGSGEHGTTKGCLLALLQLEARNFTPRHVLDMGTGSGILALAAARLWDAPVLGVDNDAEAVRVAARHAQFNKITSVEFAEGDGFSAPAVRKAQPFDLVIANILAGPLVQMAADLCAATAPGGRIILSGLLADQGDEVAGAYRDCGLPAPERLEHSGWATLLFSKPD